MTEKIAHYRILGKLGAGGMGEVYLAEDTKLRRVALKFLLPDAASDPRRMHRFLQEARAAASLHHENIAHIYEIGEEPSSSWSTSRGRPSMRALTSVLSTRAS